MNCFIHKYHRKKDVTLTKKDYITNLTVVAEGISAANFRLVNLSSSSSFYL